MARFGIIVDLNRCTGCMTCVIACKQENLTRPEVWWLKILEVENEPLDDITYVRYGCMHCDDPPCVEACPNQAIYKRADGIVLVDQEKCKGTGLCVKACPYGVIEINSDGDYFPGQKAPYEEIAEAHRVHPLNMASKCTLCAHRVDQGEEPVCVAGCPSTAMVFGDLDDPQSPISQRLAKSTPLLASEKANPKVTYAVSNGLLPNIEQRVRDNPKMVR